MSYPPPIYPVVNGEARGHRALRHLSPSLNIIAAAVFAGGVAAGCISYLDRSPVLQKHIPGTAAWPQQLVVAALAGEGRGGQDNQGRGQVPGPVAPGLTVHRGVGRRGCDMGLSFLE